MTVSRSTRLDSGVILDGSLLLLVQAQNSNFDILFFFSPVKLGPGTVLYWVRICCRGMQTCVLGGNSGFIKTRVLLPKE